jgi:hypothetical protein
MSAAATAAGYLYASGRLRARGKDEDGNGRDEHRRPERREEKHEARGAPRRRPLRITAVREVEPEPAHTQQRPRTAVKVEYRTRRWRPSLDE